MTGMLGILWYEKDPEKPLETRISEAAAHYRQKYGKEPDVCLVPPGETCQAPPGITVVESTTIQRNHLLIGVKHGTR